MKVFILLFFCALALPAFGQKFFYLSAKGKTPIHRYAQDDSIEFKLFGVKGWQELSIKDLDSTYLYTNAGALTLESIEAFKIRKAIPDLLSSAAIYGGLGFAGIAGLNAIINKDVSISSQTRFIAGMGMVTALGISGRYLWARKVYKVEKGYYLRKIDFDEFK